MAKEQNQQEKPIEQTDQKPSSEKKAQIITGFTVAGIILIFAVAGFFLGQALVEMRPETIVMAGVAGPAGMKGASESPSTVQQPDNKRKNTEKTWYYQMKPVLANLDDPGATRYVRATLTLEVFNTLTEDKGKLLLDEKERHLRDWLAIYLAGLALDDVRGDKNLKRIQAQVLEAFNKKLFPNTQPQIGRILFEEFAVQ